MRADILGAPSVAHALLVPTSTAAGSCATCGDGPGQPCGCGRAPETQLAQLIHIRVIAFDVDVEETVVLGDCSGCGERLIEQPTGGFPRQCPSCARHLAPDHPRPSGTERAAVGRLVRLHTEQ